MPDLSKPENLVFDIREFSNSIKLESVEFSIDNFGDVEYFTFNDLQKTLRNYTILNVTAIVNGVSGSGDLTLENSVDGGQNFVTYADSLFSDGSNGQTVDSTQSVYSYSLTEFTEDLVRLKLKRNGSLSGGTVKVIIIAKDKR